jgi:hypothetical protein
MGGSGSKSKGCTQAEVDKYQATINKKKEEYEWAKEHEPESYKSYRQSVVYAREAANESCPGASFHARNTKRNTKRKKKNKRKMLPQLGKRNPWIKAVQRARKELGITGFKAVKKKTRLYKLAKKYHEQYK